MNINGAQVDATSSSAQKEIDLPDGTMEQPDGTSTTYTAVVNGNTWTNVVTGSATMHYEDSDGMVLISDISAHGTSTLRENGAYNNSTPLYPLSGAVPLHLCRQHAARVLRQRLHRVQPPAAAPAARQLRALGVSLSRYRPSFRSDPSASIHLWLVGGVHWPMAVSNSAGSDRAITRSRCSGRRNRSAVT